MPPNISLEPTRRASTHSNLVLPAELPQNPNSVATALLANLCQEATQSNIRLMTPDQQRVIQAFLDAGALTDKVSCDFVQTAKEALTGLERVAVHGAGDADPLQPFCGPADRGQGCQQGAHCGGVVKGGLHGNH